MGGVDIEIPAINGAVNRVKNLQAIAVCKITEPVCKITEPVCKITDGDRAVTFSFDRPSRQIKTRDFTGMRSDISDATFYEPIKTLRGF